MWGSPWNAAIMSLHKRSCVHDYDPRPMFALPQMFCEARPPRFPTCFDMLGSLYRRDFCVDSCCSLDGKGFSNSFVSGGNRLTSLQETFGKAIKT